MKESSTRLWSVVGIASALTVVFLAQGRHSSAWIIALTGVTIMCAVLVLRSRFFGGSHSGDAGRTDSGEQDQ